MRKRIPVAPCDIDLNGRPGCISRLAFQVKKLAQGGALKLGEAQRFLSLGFGYRHFPELVEAGRSGAERFPDRGTIALRDIRQTFAWGIHRKCSISFLDAIRLAEKVDFKQLKIFEYTVDCALEKYSGTGSMLILDEYGSYLADPLTSSTAAELIAAGAPPFSYTVKRTDAGPVLQKMADLVDAAQELPKDLVEILAEENAYAQLDAETRREAYFRHELVVGQRISLLTAVREGFVPEGVSVCILTNRHGDFRGRSVYFEEIGGLVPRIHRDGGVYEDVARIATGGIVSGTIEGPSQEGSLEGTLIMRGDEGPTIITHVSDDRFNLDDAVAKAVYAGDEELYRVQPYQRGLVQRLNQLIDEGKLDEVKVDPTMLIKLDGVVYRDGRFETRPIISLTPPPPLFEGTTFTPQTAENQHFCGETMSLDDQPLVRDQGWLREDDVPEFILDPRAFESYQRPDSLMSDRGVVFLHPMFFGLVPEWATKVYHQFNRAWEKAKAEPFFDLDNPMPQFNAPDGGLSWLLAKAIRHMPSGTSPADLEAPVIRTLRRAADINKQALQASGITLDQDLLQSFTELHDKALQELVHRGNTDGLALQSIGIENPIVAGWLSLAGQGIPLQQLVQPDFYELRDKTTDSVEHGAIYYGRVIAALILGPCFDSTGQSMDTSPVASDEVLLTVAHKVFQGEITPSNALVGTQQLQRAVDKAEQTMLRIGRVATAEKELSSRAKAARSAGFLSVGRELRPAVKRSGRDGHSAPGQR